MRLGRFISAGMLTLFSMFSLTAAEGGLVFSLFSLIEGLRVFRENSLLIFSVLTHLGGGDLRFTAISFVLAIFTVFTHWLGMGRFRLTCCFQCFTRGGGGVDHTQNHAVFTHELSRQQMQQHIFTPF